MSNRDADRPDRAALRAWMGPRTQTTAATELRTAQSQISEFLSGRREIGARLIRRWSKITGIPAELFYRCKLESLDET